MTSSSIAEARACICSVLSFARWIARPVLSISRPIPVAASPIRTCASAAEYWALITSFCERNCSIFADELLLARDELLLLVLQLLHLRVEILELLLDPGLPLERLPGEVLAAGGECLARLRVERDDVLLQLLRLELEPLLGRDDVGDAALDVLQRLELLLVGVVERLVRVLGAVQQRAELRPDDLAGSCTAAPSSVPPHRRCRR